MPSESRTAIRYKAKGIRLESYRNPRNRIFEISTSQHLALMTGTSNIPLVRRIARIIHEDFGIATGRFEDGHIVDQLPASVDGRDVFVVQSTAPSANNLMEQLQIIDACNRAGARSITAVNPFLYGSRQDRKDAPRVSITARLVADMLAIAGATRFATINVHAEQISGFFDGSFNDLPASAVFVPELTSLDLKKPVYVAVDIGGDKKVPKFAIRAGADPDADTATVVKERRNGKAKAKFIQGNVKGRDVVFVDDIVNSGSSIISAAEVACAQGAERVFAMVTHGMMMNGDGRVNEKALQALMDSPIEKMIITDTIRQPSIVVRHPKIKIISAAPLLAEAIKRLHRGESMSPDLVD